MPKPPASDVRRHHRVFLAAVSAELLVGAIALAVLLRSGRPELIAPVIALVVALHFLIFLLEQRAWIHLLTGTVGILGAAAAIMLLVTGTVEAATGRAIAGLTLAACTLTYALVFLRMLRRASYARG